MVDWYGKNMGKREANYPIPRPRAKFHSLPLSTIKAILEGYISSMTADLYVENVNGAAHLNAHRREPVSVYRGV